MKEATLKKDVFVTSYFIKNSNCSPVSHTHNSP